jgi:ABC-type branched-subunit amino acid transport system substrate-binding protein
MRTKLSVALGATLLVAVMVTTLGSATRSVQTASMTVLAPSKAVTARLKLSTVNVGTIINIATPSSDESGTAAVLVATARFFNRAGGLHGHPIGVYICNAKADSNVSAQCARDMASKNVVAILGGQDTFDGVSQPILQQEGIPEIGISALSPAALSGSNVFLFGVPSAVAFTSLAAFATLHNGESPMAMAITDNSAADPFAQPILDAMKSVGQTFQPEVKVAPANADYASIAASIANQGSKSLLLVIGGSNLTNVINQANQTAPSVKHFYLNGNLALSVLTAAFSSSILQKIVIAAAYPPFSDPSMSQFMKAMTAEQKRGDFHADPSQLAPRDVDPYAAMKALIAATKGLKTITASTVMSAMNKASNLNIGPFLAPWTPTAPGPAAGAPRSPNTSVWFMTLDSSGNLKLLLPKPVSLANALKNKFS